MKTRQIVTLVMCLLLIAGALSADSFFGAVHDITTGIPINQATVSLIVMSRNGGIEFQGDDITDSNGDYSFSGFTADQCFALVTCVATGFDTFADSTTAHGDTQFDIDMFPSGTQPGLTNLSGTVTNDNTGLAIPFATITLESGPAIRYETITDFSGYYTIDLPPDTYILTAAADIGIPFMQHQETIVIGATPVVHDIILTPLDIAF